MGGLVTWLTPVGKIVLLFAVQIRSDAGMISADITRLYRRNMQAEQTVHITID